MKNLFDFSSNWKKERKLDFDKIERLEEYERFQKEKLEFEEFRTEFLKSFFNFQDALYSEMEKRVEKGTVDVESEDYKEFIELYTENRKLKDLSLMMEEITKNPDLSEEIMNEFLKEEE